MVVNVYGISGTENYGRRDLLNWINQFSSYENKKVELLSNGISYLLALSKLFPNCNSAKKVNLNAKFSYEFLQNWKCIQMAFSELKIDKEIPVSKLTQSRFQDNFEFLQWFRKFSDANGAENLCAVADTNGTVSQTTTTQPQYQPCYNAAVGNGKNVSNGQAPILNQISDLEHDLEMAVRERDFYFSKLQRLETILVQEENSNSDMSKRLLDIMYENDLS